MKGIFSSPAVSIIAIRTSGDLVGEPWWATRSSRSDSSIRPCEAVTSFRRASSSRPTTPMLVWGSSPLSRARPQAQAT